jgi:hypothetical protein|nr:MAG TPA_asm: PORTAL PROTEIN [Caudoviricetes sp.]
MAQGIGYLKRKLALKQSRVQTRYRYYEMKECHTPRNLMVPVELRNKFSIKLGWCTKAVDSLADRLQFRGFRNDNLDLTSIYQMNNFDVLADSAILGALITSCDFIYISMDKNGYPRMQVIDGYNATGIMDEITGMLEEGYAVLDRDENDQIVSEAYFAKGYTDFYIKGQEPYRIENICSYPLLVPIVYRPDAKRPFGHSRISRACMKYQNNVADTLLNMAICSETNAFVQKYIAGSDPDMEFDSSRAWMSSFLNISASEDGTKPDLGQFQQASLAPYIDEIETQASLFAGEVGLTLDDLGFSKSNPASVDAIRASHENLRLTARKAQRQFGIGFLNAGYLAACLRDDFDYNREVLYETKPIWEPVFEPDANAIGMIGDAAVKVNSAVPGYFNAENLRDLTGIDSDE